jgi:hypothetical protein
MDMWMDVDTALAEVPVNLMPLIDDTDFKTRETAIAYNASGMDLVWNFVTTGGAYTQTAVTPTTAGAYDWTHQGGGMYSIEIPASGGASINNDTEGFGWFSGVVTGVLPWRGPVIGFRAAALNDALIDSAWSTTRGLAGTALPNAAADAAGGLIISDAGGLDADAQRSDVAAILVDTGTTLDGRIPAALVGGRMDANMGAISSDSTAADNAEAFFDGTGYAGTGNTIPTVTTLTNAPSDSSGVTTLLSRLSSARAGYLDNLSAGAVALASSLSTLQTDVTTLLGRITSSLFTGITSLAQWLGLIAGKQTGNSTARTEIRATGAGSGTFDETTDSVEALRDRGDASWVTGTTPPTAAAIADQVWEEAIADHSGTAGSTAEALNAAGSAGDPWTTAIPGAYGAGSAGYILGNRVDAAISTRATPAQVNTEADTALSDVGLTTTITGRIDAAISTRLASASYSSPPSAATIASQVRTELTTELARIDAAISTRLATAGYTVPLDAAGVRSALGMASANLDTQLAALDTLLDTAIANIAALNNISTAQVLTQVNTALDTAISELGVGAPTATPSLRTGLMLLYMALRNRGTTTATAQTIQNDAGTTIATATLSDDATTYTKTEFA